MDVFLGHWCRFCWVSSVKRIIWHPKRRNHIAEEFDVIDLISIWWSGVFSLHKLNELDKERNQMKIPLFNMIQLWYDFDWFTLTLENYTRKKSIVEKLQGSLGYVALVNEKRNSRWAAARNKVKVRSNFKLRYVLSQSNCGSGSSNCAIVGVFRPLPKKFVETIKGK